MDIQGVFRHCLDKVFPVDADWKNDYRNGSALRGERFSMQFVYKVKCFLPVEISLELKSPLKKYCTLFCCFVPFFIRRSLILLQ